MKLFACWNVRPGFSAVGGHPCGRAHAALVEVGHEPEVVYAKGSNKLPDRLNRSTGRQEVKRRSGGDVAVPALITDSDEFIQGSEEIIAWAGEHPAGSS